MERYKLYLDKNNAFQCKLALEGASLNGASVRVILESADRSYLYKGTITESGHCTVDINKLSGVFKSGDSGRIKLEVIAEESYFLPWETQFEVDMSKKVVVEVAPGRTVSKKPTMKISVNTPQTEELDRLAESIVTRLKRSGINSTNIKKNKMLFNKHFIAETTSAKFKHDVTEVITEVLKKLS